MGSRGLDIAQRTRSLEFDFLGSQRPQLAGGYPHCQHAVSDPRPGGYDSARGDQRIFPDLGAIQYDRPDSDQRPIVYATSMHDRAVSDRNFVPKDRREPTLGDMKGGLILDVRAFADADSLNVASQHRREEDAGILADLDISDDGGSGRNPHALV